MYIGLGQAAGAQMPYRVQGDRAYSRAFLERVNLPFRLRDDYIPAPGSTAAEQAKIWRAAGLDPFRPIPISEAQAKLSPPGGVTVSQFQLRMRNKAEAELFLRENSDLIAADESLARQLRLIFRKGVFDDPAMATLRKNIADAIARRKGEPVPAQPPLPPVIERPIIAERLIVERPLVITPPVDVVAGDTGIEIVRERPPAVSLPSRPRPPAIMPRLPVESVKKSKLLPLLVGGGVLLLILRKARK